MSRIFDAVTAVLMHDGEMLINRRQPHLNAFPGFHSFPGGKVDRADPETPLEHALLAAHPPRLLRALARELLEELGYDLLAALAAGEVLELSSLGIALTPPVMPVRFNTHFFRVVLARRPALAADPAEVADYCWAAPAELLRRFERGELLCAPPTIATMRALAADAGATDIPGLHFENRPFSELPMVEPLHELRQIWVRSNTIPPAEHTNCFLVGDFQNHRILVDPSPNNDEEFEKLCALAERMSVREVFITHHHPDHRDRADALARRLNLPVGMSADTQDRIFRKTAGRFFEGLNGVNLYREGDVVCRWLGEPVRVLEVPGHDEGQLALMPDSRAWCIVGDLIQGVGTVVIARPEGNMRKYYASLQKIIDLAPRVILPSHGGALGTVHRLQETLKHRQLREQQVLALHGAGQTVEQMLAAIYKDVDARLWPLARLNIESHLEKLREDGLIAA